MYMYTKINELEEIRTIHVYPEVTIRFQHSGTSESNLHVKRINCNFRYIRLYTEGRIFPYCT